MKDCIISLPLIIVMVCYILLSTHFNNTSIRHPTKYSLVAVINDMSIISCPPFIYYLLAIHSFTIYDTSND